MSSIPFQIQETYNNFNSRNIDAVLKVFHTDVEWPNGWEGGYLQGHELIREYWTRQWAVIDPTVTPESVTTLEDGRLNVLVKQLVKDLDGNTLSDQYIHHVYTFKDGLITRMDIVPFE